MDDILRRCKMVFDILNADPSSRIRYELYEGDRPWHVGPGWTDDPSKPIYMMPVFTDGSGHVVDDKSRARVAVIGTIRGEYMLPFDWHDAPGLAKTALYLAKRDDRSSETTIKKVEDVLKPWLP